MVRAALCLTVAPLLAAAVRQSGGLDPTPSAETTKEDIKALLSAGLNFHGHADLPAEDRDYLTGKAGTVETWPHGSDGWTWLIEAMEKLEKTGVEVDDHDGTPIGEGESIGLVGAKMVMDRDQIDLLPQAFQSGLFAACPETGCPEWPVGLRVSHTLAVGINALRFALKIGVGTVQDDEIDLTFTETLESFPISDRHVLEAFTYAAKSGKGAAFLWYPIQMVRLLWAARKAYAHKSETEQNGPTGKIYHSMTPWLIGGQKKGETPGAMKYRLVPKNPERSPFPTEKMDTTESYKKAMRDSFTHEISTQDETVFDFEIQVATDPAGQRINDASSVWDESTAPWVRMGTLTIPKQEFKQPVDVGNCVGSGLWEEGAGEAAFNSKEMLFSPNKSPHRPLGDINLFRAGLYARYDRARQVHLLGKEGGDPVVCPFKNIEKLFH